MSKGVLKIFAFLFLCALSLPNFFSRDQTQTDENRYGSGFFDQLEELFGRFRNADLQNVFREAQPIQCPELIWRKGEWRPVAFFNEDRRLGYWCRVSLDEVKADLTVFAFKGTCGEGSGKVKVATRFPTAAGMKAYQQGKIDLNQVDVIVNKPVNAAINSKTSAYTFELPYLFLKDEGLKNIFSFNPPNRYSVYDFGVSSLWECKAIFSKDVTYRFMICRMSTFRKDIGLGATRHQEAGDSAFFILSDGIEAQTSVKMTIDEKSSQSDNPE